MSDAMEERKNNIVTMTESTSSTHATKEIQIPEWDEAAKQTGARSVFQPSQLRSSVSRKLDAVLPPHRKYLGRTRKTFLIILIAIFFCLLALIIGFAVGLSSHKYAKQMVTSTI